jgi:putative glutamine amidotransferase
MNKTQPPVIGITADLSADSSPRSTPAREPTLFLAQRYYRAVAQAGSIPVILPPVSGASAIRQTLHLLDGIVISGGGFDIHPNYYGEKPMAQLGVIKSNRTQFELDLTAGALKNDLPVLGICGGAQALNVVLGGSLYQDIASQVPNAAEHEQSKKKDRSGHRVQIAENSRLGAIVQRRAIEVNTTHHQAVKVLGRGLVATAIAPDGIIEAIESTRHRFAIGVQWHPEVLAPRRIDQRRIFEAFIAACKRRA